MQYAPGKYDKYIALGNQFKFGDATIQLDLMNRGTSLRDLCFDNFSVMGEFSYLVADRVNVFAKATYDKIGDSAVAASGLIPGTELTRVGGGVEYYPLGGKGNRDIRLHAAYSYTLGVNTNFQPSDACDCHKYDENGQVINVFKGTAQNKLGYFTIGLTWKIDVIEGVKNLLKK
jgi:hypothetical protein